MGASGMNLHYERRPLELRLFGQERHLGLGRPREWQKTPDPSHGGV